MTNRSSLVEHTPGPWRACTTQGRVHGFDAGGEYLRDVLTSYHFSKEEREANARLISAAPEMFDLLIKFMGAVAHSAPPEAFEEYANEAHEILRKAGAEI